MAIEANLGVMGSRASALQSAAREFEEFVVKVRWIRNELQRLGQPMTNAQKSAALAEGIARIAACETALSNLRAAWDSNTPIVE